MTDPRQAILAFRAAYLAPCGPGPGTATEQGQALALQGARLQAVALLLEADPGRLAHFLDLLVWHSDLSVRHLDAAREEAGLPIPILTDLDAKRHYPPRFPTLSQLLGAEVPPTLDD